MRHACGICEWPVTIYLPCWYFWTEPLPAAWETLTSTTKTTTIHFSTIFFNNIYYNIRAYTISFKEIPASPCRNLLTLLNQRMEYSHGHKIEQQTCKETQPTPGSKHQRLYWPFSMGLSENAIFDPTLCWTLV